MIPTAPSARRRKHVQQCRMVKSQIFLGTCSADSRKHREWRRSQIHQPPSEHKVQTQGCSQNTGRKNVAHVLSEPAPKLFSIALLPFPGLHKGPLSVLGCALLCWFLSASLRLALIHLASGKSFGRCAYVCEWLLTFCFADSSF